MEKEQNLSTAGDETRQDRVGGRETKRRVKIAINDPLEAGVISPLPFPLSDQGSSLSEARPTAPGIFNIREPSLHRVETGTVTNQEIEGAK